MRCDSQAPRPTSGDLQTSAHPAIFTRCVRRTCRRVGALPVCKIRRVAWLSSKNRSLTERLHIASNKIMVGNASNLKPTSAAAISASAVLCDTAVCFFDWALIGKKIVLPAKFRLAPETDFESTLSDAKSESVYSHNSQSFLSSPTQPRNCQSLDCQIYATSQCNC